MKKQSTHSNPLSYEALHEERVKLRSQLEKAGGFDNAEQRAFARERFSILTKVLNTMYIEKHGLR
jgi:hypothetical protein